MVQRDIKSNDGENKKKEEKRSEKKQGPREQEQKEQKIELTPQDAYRFFQEEQRRLEKLNEDIEITEAGIIELDKTIFALKELKEAKEKDVFINLGNGVFAKAKLEDTTNFVVDYASKAMLTKSVDEIIENLMQRKTLALNTAKKLHEVQIQTQENISNLYRYLTKIQQTQRQERERQ